MSVKVMTWVWDHSRSRSTDRLVLLAIADCASEDGSNAYPSMAELRRKTGLSERAIQYAFKALIGLGELFVSQNGGPRGCNRYRVVMLTPGDGVSEADPASFAPPPQVVREALPDGSQMWQLTPQDVHPARDAGVGASDAPGVHEVRSKGATGAPGTVLEPSNKKTSSTSSKRGTRIPEDFTVTEEMRGWAREHVPYLAGAGETEKFVDYWRSRAGAAAVKLDWVATWRNWMRNAAERAGPSRPSVNGTKPSTTNLKVQAGLDLAAKLDGLDERKEITR